jgi:lysophospholipase L1-like esterase
MILENDPTLPVRFQSEILAFVQSDAQSPPPRGAVLFVGSSIVRFWDSLAADMSPLPVINRGFGGACTWEVLHYMDKIVTPCDPRIIAYYCGSNDIGFGATAADIYRRFHLFVQRCREGTACCGIYFISIIAAPQKRGRWCEVAAANSMVERYAAHAPGVGFIDVNPALCSGASGPRPDLFAQDGLHLTPAAYRKLSAVIKPVIETRWNAICRSGS